MSTPPVPGNVSRRAMLLGSAMAGAGVVLGGLPKTAAAAELSLYVFVHTFLEPRALGRQFERALPGVSVWVLTRARDFSRVRAREPDGVLALAPVLEANGFMPALQGQRNGQTAEPYVLLSTVPVAPREVKSVGVVDILGRRQMSKFVASLLGGNEPAVTPVTKLADLLALLQLGRVEAVLLPAREAGPLMTRTRLSLKLTRLEGAMVGLPAYSALTAGGKHIAGMLDGLAADDVLQQIGVDSWR